MDGSAAHAQNQLRKKKQKKVAGGWCSLTFPLLRGKELQSAPPGTIAGRGGGWIRPLEPPPSGPRFWGWWRGGGPEEDREITSVGKFGDAGGGGSLATLALAPCGAGARDVRGACVRDPRRAGGKALLHVCVCVCTYVCVRSCVRACVWGAGGHGALMCVC